MSQVSWLGHDSPQLYIVCKIDSRLQYTSKGVLSKQLLYARKKGVQQTQYNCIIFIYLDKLAAYAKENSIVFFFDPLFIKKRMRWSAVNDCKWLQCYFIVYKALFVGHAKTSHQALTLLFYLSRLFWCWFAIWTRRVAVVLFIVIKHRGHR